MSVSLSDVRKVYDGRAAVDGVSAEIPQGAFFVALGPSGCGKSTLLRLIAGLETLDAGHIALGGRAVAGPGMHLAPEARGVGVVFQSYALWPHMSVARNVAFPIEAAGGVRRAALAEAQRHLAAVDLADLADRRPAALSGGQRQRVALARCLASRARTVLMDEPLANLDPHLRTAMEHELADFHRRSGATTFYITHDQREAMALADLVAVMRAGRFEQVAPPETVYARPASEHVARFIGHGAVLPVRVTGAEGGRAHVETGSGALSVGCMPGTVPGAGRVVIRPEDVVLAPGWSEGRVVAASYRGGAWEAAVEAGLGEPVPVVSRTRPGIGEFVPIRLIDGWLLPA